MRYDFEHIFVLWSLLTTFVLSLSLLLKLQTTNCRPKLLNEVGGAVMHHTRIVTSTSLYFTYSIFVLNDSENSTKHIANVILLSTELQSVIFTSHWSSRGH